MVVVVAGVHGVGVDVTNLSTKLTKVGAVRNSKTYCKK